MWACFVSMLAVMNEQHHDYLALALGELAASANHHDLADSGDARVCPVCGETMTLFKQFDVVMDICDKHGVWLDQGELATLLERTYWHRREADEAIDRNPGQHMDETRRTFTAGMRRVAGCVARLG